jgi:hypothetical protein
MQGWIVDLTSKYILYRQFKRIDNVYIRYCFIYYHNGYFVGQINRKKKVIIKSLSLFDLIIKIDKLLISYGVIIKAGSIYTKPYDSKGLSCLCKDIDKKLGII